MRRNKKRFLVGAALLCMLLLTGAHAWAQNLLEVGSFGGNVGDRVTVAVSLTNPASVVGSLQFALMYDDALLTAESATGVAGLPPVEFHVEAGVITCVVLDPAGALTIGISANPRPVAHVTFLIEGVPAGPSLLQLGEAVLSDVNADELAVGVQAGVFGNALMVGDGTAPPGQVVAVDVTLMNVENIGALQFTVNYNEALLDFVGGVTGPGAPDASVHGDGAGAVRTVVLDVTAPAGQTILQPMPGGRVLVTLSFGIDVGAAPGTVIPLTLSSVLLSDVNGNPTIDASLAPGMITVGPSAAGIQAQPIVLNFDAVFGTTKVGQQAGPLLFTIRNIGADPLTNVQISSGDASFTVAMDGGFAGTMAVGQEIGGQVFFNPQAPIPYTVNLVITGDPPNPGDPQAEATIVLMGTGVAPPAPPAPPTGDFTIGYLGTVIAAFGATPDSGDLPLMVTFTDQSTDTYEVEFTAHTTNALGIEWDFGDGTIMPGGNNVTHTYAPAALPTSYTVTLTVLGDPSATPSRASVSHPVTFGFGYDWDFGDGGASTDQNPVHTYAAVGDFDAMLTVTASGGRTDTATQTIRVTAPLVPVVVRIEARPAGPVAIDPDETAQYTVVAIYSDGSEVDITDLVLWEYTDGAIGSIDATGLFTPLGPPGTTEATAVYTPEGEFRSNALSITVNRVPVSLAVTPGSMTQVVVVGGTIQYDARLTYSDGGTENVTDQSAWTSSNLNVATVGPATGLATMVAKGTTVIEAAFDGFVASSTLILTPEALVSIFLTPVNPTILFGASQQFIANGVFGTATDTVEINGLVAWTSSDPTVATVAPGGLATSEGVGVTQIGASLGGISAPAQNLTVAPASIVVTPKAPILGLTSPWNQIQFKAVARSVDGLKTQTVTARVTWLSSNPAVASHVAAGLFRAEGGGVTNVTARLLGVTSALVGLTVDVKPPVIIGRTAPVGLDTSRVAISWVTDEKSTSVVEYDGTSVVDTAKVTRHNIVLGGFRSNTLVTYRAKSADRFGNESPFTAPDTVRTLSVPDTSAPRFARLPAATPNDSSAVISFTTNELCTAEVRYGLTGAYELGAVPVLTLSTVFEVTLTGLVPDTTYHYNVVITDTRGLTAQSGDRTFRTLETADIEPPQIVSGPFVISLTQTEATIGWHTNESGTSLAEYGLTVGLGLLREGLPNVFQHEVTLTNLTSDTRYYYRVGTADVAGNGPTYSAIDSFLTPAVGDTVAPEFTSRPSVLSTTNTSATIVYNTNEPTDTRVKYGTTRALGQTAATPDLSLIHSITLTNLLKNTQYFFQAVATDLAGNTSASAIDSFRTKEEADTVPPDIFGEVVEVQDVTATIQWRTNEPASSQVIYRRTGGTERNVVDPSPVVEHRVTLAGLVPGAVYFYTIVSEDLAGNRAQKTGLSFTTLLEADVTPPFISSEVVRPLPGGRALVSWTTDEPASGTVLYGKARNALNFQVSRVGLTTVKSVQLAGLTPGTQYFYRLVATDAAGNRKNKRPGRDFFFTFRAIVDVTSPVLVEGPAFPYRSDTRAVVSWITDEPSDTRVFSRPAGASTFDFFQMSPTLTTNHTMTLTNLLAGRGYEIVIMSVDSWGNPMIYPEGAAVSLKAIQENLHDNEALAKLLQLAGGLSFETTLEGDDQLPVITSGPTITASTTGSPAKVTIEWTTDETSDSEVEFGLAGEGASAKAIGWFEQTEPDFEFRRMSGEDVMVHRMVLSGLQVGQSYIFRVGSTDPSDNGPAYSLPSVFLAATEADVEPPEISGTEVLAITDRQATVRWQTDEVSDSRVEFGLAPDVFDDLRLDPTDVTDHKLALTNLEPATTYYYRVGSVDFADNYGAGRVREFTTADLPDLTPPVLSDVAATATGGTRALIRWKTDELADSYVEYGPDATLGLEVQALTDVLAHEVTLSNLAPDTEIFYRVGSIDRAGNPIVWSDVFTFIPTADIQAPSAPASFEAIPGNERVYLRWQPNVEPDLAGYDVYRSRAGGAFRRIAAQLTVPTFVDQNVENGVDYTYYVQALDQAPDPNVSAASVMLVTAPAVANVPASPSVEGIDPKLFPSTDVVDGIRVSTTTRPWLVVQAPTELGASLPGAALTFVFVIASDPDFADVRASSIQEDVYGKEVLDLVTGVPKAVGEDWFGWQVPSDVLDIGDEYWWRVRVRKGGVLRGLWMEPETLMMAEQGVAVELAAFAGHEDRGAAVIEWVTAMENGHAGFHLYRSTTEDGTYQRITPELITGGNPYRYRDETVKLGRTYYYKLEAVDFTGVGQSFGPVAVRVTAPATYSLAQNHPNPFNPETAIEFALPSAGEVTLTIYNLTGQEVVTLVHGRLDAGLHTALWDGRDQNGVELASGVYIYRITAGTFAKARKMVLVK